jgi:dCMP deaminase
MTNRITWSEYALRLAHVAALRSEDPRTKVGCCILRHDNTVASLGYNGAPAGVEIEWNNREEKHKRVIHAEVNACRMIKPGECYLAAITHSPCNDCLKTLAAYGIKQVVYSTNYKFTDDYSPIEIGKDFGIEVKQIALTYSS